MTHTKKKTKMEFNYRLFKLCSVQAMHWSVVKEAFVPELQESTTWK